MHCVHAERRSLITCICVFKLWLYHFIGRYTGQPSLISQPQLCEECNKNQATKIQELHSFEPTKEVSCPHIQWFTYFQHILSRLYTQYSLMKHSKITGWLLLGKRVYQLLECYLRTKDYNLSLQINQWQLKDTKNNS